MAARPRFPVHGVSHRVCHAALATRRVVCSWSRAPGLLMTQHDAKKFLERAKSPTYGWRCTSCGMEVDRNLAPLHG